MFLSKQNSLIAHALGGFDTVRRMLASGVVYECRTTWHAGLFSVDDLFALADTLADAGVAHWALQECRAPGVATWEPTAAQVERLGRGLPGLWCGGGEGAATALGKRA